MSKLEGLIKELCSNGVEFLEINDICKVVNAPVKLKTNEYSDYGKYPIIDQGQEQVVGYTDNEDYLLPFDEYVLFGDHTREVKYFVGQFAQGADGLKILKCNVQTVLPRYFYHCCLNFRIASRGYSRHWSHMKKVLIPVPPLPVQQEIVRVLDEYSQATDSLKNELEAELTARKKQHEFYRDCLLSFNNDGANSVFSQWEELENFSPAKVEYKSLEKCCKVLDNLRKPITKSARIAGIYPYYGANGIQDYVNEYIFDGKFVLVGEDGSVITKHGTPVVTWAEGKIWVNNHAHVIEEIDGVMLRYLYHYLQTADITGFVHGNIPKLTGKDFRTLQIPVPPLEVQERIVDVLDNFDAMCSDLAIRLVEEVEKRQKQYQHYRNKLLTFNAVNC